MNKITFIGLLLIVMSCGKHPTSNNLNEKDTADVSVYVDPNIGTAHSRWFFYTPVAVPFGMAKLGPSTNGSYGNEQGWEAVGYDERHQSIEGFANLHEFQIGGFLFTAMTGETGEMEEIVGGHPAIAECAVVGIHDELKAQ